MDSGAVLGSLALLLTAGFAIVGQEVVKKAAGRGVDEWFDSNRWQAALARELEKVRGTERQELRFTAYGGLWKAMRPLALYDEGVFGRRNAEDLSKALSDWYFSEAGGLMLTSHAREFYFALQSVVGRAAAIPGWEARRGEEDPAAVFERVLSARAPRVEDVEAHLDGIADADWPAEDTEQIGKNWKTRLEELVETSWMGLDDNERYAVLQQVSSRLRTVLTKDVESRLR